MEGEKVSTTREEEEREDRTDLARSRSTLFDQIERPQLSKALQQLHHLLIIQITRQPSHKDLVDRIGHVGANDSGDVRGDFVRVGTDKVFGTADFEGRVGEDYAVETEGGRAFGGVAELFRFKTEVGRGREREERGKGGKIQ